VALILPHKTMSGFTGGAIGADIYCDRTGIHARKLADCAKILDALRDPVEGYYDPRDPFTTVPRSSILSTRYADHAKTPRVAKALASVRIGVIRESMIYPKGSKTEEPIVVAAAEEIKTTLGDVLGAKLVESSDPLWQRGPDFEQMRIDFRRALAKLVPLFMPELLFRLDHNGQPLFKEFAAAITPTEFVPGKVFGTGTAQPIDYFVAMTEGSIAPPANLDLATIQQQELANTFRFHISQYLMRRARDWKTKGFTETLADWRNLNVRSKFWGDDQRAAFLNWEDVSDPRNPLDGRQGVNERVMLRELLRRVDMTVILENKLDALVRLHTPWPPGLIGHPHQYDIPSNLTPESLSGPNAGLTEVLVPAGYVTIAYDPVFSLSADGTRYVSTPPPARRPTCPSPACRSRSSFALSRAWKTYSSRLLLPTKRHPIAASRRRLLVLCRQRVHRAELQ
jgi:amidase